MSEAESAAPRSTPDLVGGAIGPTLLAFALPTLGSNILQSLNGSINAVWVGQFLGERGLAATSNANLIMFLMFTAIFGFGMAATIIGGQAMGRRDVDGMRRIFGTATGLFAIMGIVTAAVGWAISPALLRLLATPPDVQELALTYLRITFLAMPPSIMIVLITMGLRSTGDTLTPMWFMVLSTVIDCALNPVLIVGLGPFPALGIAGSGLASLIANGISLVALIAYIYARDSIVRLRGAELRYLRPDPSLLRILATKGVPMGMQMIVMSTASLALLGLVNRFGTDTIAAYGAINQLWGYLAMPAIAIAAAVSAMAAQNIGAGQWERVPHIARAGALANLVLTGSLYLVVLLIDRPALALFLGGHGDAVEIGRHINLLAGWSFVLFGISSIYSAVMRANAVAGVPLLILFVAMFPVRLGLATLLLPRFGADALWIAFSVGVFAGLVMTLLYYRFGNWRKATTLPPPSALEAEERALADAEPVGHQKPIG